MKTNLLFLTLSVLFISFSCKKLKIEKELRIDVGTQFQNDVVTIKLDDDVVFSGSVSTNTVLGVSEILTFNYPIGQYHISVIVNGVEKTSKFKHKKNRFIYISYEKQTSDITISFPNEKYIYD